MGRCSGQARQRDLREGALEEFLRDNARCPFFAEHAGREAGERGER